MPQNDSTEKRCIYLPAKIWRKLDRRREKLGVPVSRQIRIALLKGDEG